MPPVNVAVVGLGFMGVTHLKAYRKIPGARIAALCDAVRLPLDGDFSTISGNVGDAEPLKLDMTGIRATHDINELLADPQIDLIDLCVPTSVHPRLAIAALEAGKHVVCEKPLARTAALAREIVEAAGRSAGYFMPAMCIRFWPEYAWLKEAIDSGRYGRVLAAQFRRVSEPPVWSKDFMDGAKSGGALLDLHIHDADFVQYCFGRPKAVFASGFPYKSGVIDHVLAQYRVESGAAVSAEGSWAMTAGFGFMMGYTAVFEKATVDFDSRRSADAMRLFVEGAEPVTVHPGEEDGYLGELAHMIESIQAGRPPHKVTPADGLSAVEICEAEEASIRTGGLVVL